LCAGRSDGTVGAFAARDKKEESERREQGEDAAMQHRVQR
jgi:hypothetical protein